MAYAKHFTDEQYYNNDVHTDLRTRLKELHQQSPGHFSKPIDVLDAVDGTVEHQLERRLQHEKKSHAGKRIILIPCNLGNSHWIGILIEFEAVGQIKRAEYIDPVIGSDIIPDHLQEQFVNVYVDDVLQARNMRKEDDPRNSAVLTTDNLLKAIENDEGNRLTLFELQQRLNSGLAQVKIQDVIKLLEAIHIAEDKIVKYENQKRTEDARRKKEELKVLKELEQLSKEIDILVDSMNSDESKLYYLEQRLSIGLRKYDIQDETKLLENIQEIEKRPQFYDVKKRKQKLNELKELLQLTEEIANLKFSEKNDIRKDLKILGKDLATMPFCAEKTIMKLQEHFQRRLLGDHVSSLSRDSVFELLKQLHSQIKRQELVSAEIRTKLEELDRCIDSDNCSSTVYILKDLLKKIRPINVQELRRVVAKSEKASELIRDKDIILLVGDTKTGKSTTVQFLAGTRMKKTKVAVTSGISLEHFEPVGPVTNPGLISVTSSPRYRSETRYIAPVTVPLRDILGQHETGNITFCDTPGFGGRGDVEIDIANGVGVIEALKRCSSVKLFVLSSYESLGDRGQGIQKLAHVLNNMVNGIEVILNTTFYAFTKYPLTKTINTMLLDIKASRVDTNDMLRSDRAFVTLLNDMIEKTKNGAANIDPIYSDRRQIIEALKRMRGIEAPGDLFRFSLSEETQAAIANQVERYKSSIVCAIKHKDNDLVMYYLNDLKTFKDVFKQSFIRDAYENSIRSVEESIVEYCAEVMQNFNRSLANPDGLREEDIQDFKNFIDYIKDTQKLSKHLRSDVKSSETLMQNIESEVQTRSQILITEDLRNPLVKTFLDNLGLLKNSFKVLESSYNKSCKDFSESFERSVESVRESIIADDFKRTAETIIVILESSHLLKSHLIGQTEQKCLETVKLLLQNLSSFVDKADLLLAKTRLNGSDIERLKKYMNILRSANENSALQNRISTYTQMLKTQTQVSEKSFRDVNEIYNDFVAKVVMYFDEISARIREVFKGNEDYALENVEKLVAEMEAIRRVPELESKTVGTYYHTVENVRGYMQKLQRNAEEFIVAIDSQSRTTNYKYLARSLSRLKNAEWINRISPGAHDVLMRHITEDLMEYAHRLEDRLIKLDLSLKSPENISVAQEILEKIESMSSLENSVLELEKCRVSLFQRFSESTQRVFDRIQGTFNLQDRTVYQIKQELKELEQIKREYENLHPARVYLRKQVSVDINTLTNEIESLKNSEMPELQTVEAEKYEIESELNRLNLVVQKYTILVSEKSDSDGSRVTSIREAVYSRKSTQAEIYVRERGFSSIEAVNEAITENKKVYDTKVRQIQNRHSDFHHSLNQYESIRETHDSLLAPRQTVSSEEINFLQKRGFNSFESLCANIQEKTRIIGEREKNKQPYDFNNKLDASIANSALIYIGQCEKVRHVRVKEIAADTHIILEKYLREYGNFLNQEIQRKFNDVISIDYKGDYFQYSQDLEMRLGDLSCLRKFVHVFECMDGTEKSENWYTVFRDYRSSLSYKMEGYKMSGNHRELQARLSIAQALSCVDHFCASVFAGNGFRALYRQYQVEADSDYKVAVSAVLGYISKGDYASVAKSLSGIDDRSFNERDLTDIKHDLKNSLYKLMNNTKTSAHWFDGKIEREKDNKSEIKKIKENIERVQIALNENSITKLLENKTKRELERFIDDIDKILSDIILRGLEAIELFMNTDSFLEAEQCMENLSRVQRELGSHYTSTTVIEKNNELRTRLDGIVDYILQRDFEDISKYSVNPPRDLVAKLKMVALRGNAKFNQAYYSIIEKIKQSFSVAIDQVHSTPLEERASKISPLNYAFCFLPDELQAPFRLQIDELTKSIAGEEKTWRHELDETLKNVDDDDHTIAKIGTLAQRYSKQNMTELLEILRTETLKKLYTYREAVGRALDQQNMQSAIDIMKIIFKYKESVRSHIPEVQAVDKNVRDMIIKGFSKCCNTLVNIATIEQTQIVEEAFDSMIICIDFSTTNHGKIEQFLPEHVLRNGSDAFQLMYHYLYENSKKYQVVIQEMNITELNQVLIIAKRWNRLLQKIKQCYSKHESIQMSMNGVMNMISYTNMIDELQKEINCLKSQLDVKLISEDKILYDIEREEFFRKLMKVMNQLKEINSKLKDVLPYKIDIDKLEEELKEKIQKLGAQLLAVASKSELSERDSDQFRMFYGHLASLDKHAARIGYDVRQFLDGSRKIVFEQVTFLSNSIRASSSNVPKVAELLIKMKRFAENLLMFDSEIKAKIDEVLNTYKKEQDILVLTELIAILEKTDIGARLISDHSCLSGEDWRKRREKMQNQDNIEYALRELAGDDIVADVLDACYTTFRRTYENLIDRNLGAFNQSTNTEPDLEVLITQTKVLVATVTQKSNTVIWNKSFKDKIPELVAHICAVWTLKNTQHYNASRGINLARAYLLMPHVGQVLAIFRILGIGYQGHTKVKGPKLPLTVKLSDDLINNLVEIGTGEGKSVVMAVTACVFGLIGIDVSCSCYSEVLSTRDKNDFASVFRALGVEERIEYGTFNTLCENLLNERCNVRETVRDMIANNKSVLTVVGNTTHPRPKVLLIDEVDVFLSDKFYGGMYTPSVYLKDASIKALLDTIWQNKTVRSLNAIKVTSAYQTCASRFTNWTFLLDEAIKDMIAALQSFQSSTYIVQNDKIVYVEGESIVDNVIRGYDTVWSYYKENENGNIGQSSLDANVGIIVNCGIFSYAEMPHDFAYITGVTGTLKTLARIETDILQHVYNVQKNTFMPSVFGKSNRIYNPNYDVQVVNESEYFMRLRGEIDGVCNADRAILVFFDSEEKLMKFYESPELSSKKNDVHYITEKVSAKDRELFIRRGLTIGGITLLTRIFGRGTDFICRNQQLLLNGGVHVLQTFFSEELAEEYQIMGRGARQGDKGSYRMILLDKDLEWVLGSTWKEELPKISGTALYQALDKARSVHYETKCRAKELGIEQCKREHKASKEFMAALSAGNIEAVKRFLFEQNRGAGLVSKMSRTVLLMDGTGSMSSLLSAAKETVCTMFERASAILIEKNLPNDAFQMQIVIYRNYNSKENKILQASPWETKANNLRAFMKTIGPEGGWGQEAIEIGLWHAVKESEMENSISQVILIGDAPANTKKDVRHKRESFGEAYWQKTRFSQPTYYKFELELLMEKNIPVHSFYLTDYARDDFQKIATATRGRCEALNIHFSEGAEYLTDFVTEEILRNAAGDQGDDAVNLYRTRYVQSRYMF